MIGKRPEEGIGKGFRGVVTYLLQGSQKEKDPHRVTFTAFRNLAFEDSELVARQMRLVASQSKRVQNPVYHFVIAWRPEEGPSDEVMIQVADRTCRELGLEEHQAYYVGHDDTDHRHMHIVVNRVHPVSFRAWSPHNDFARIEVSLDRQSEELGYERVPGRHSNRARALEKHQKQRELATNLAPEAGGNQIGEPDLPIDHRRPKDSDYRRAYRERKPLPRQLLPDEQVKEVALRVATKFSDAGSWDELAKALASEGVALEKKGQGLILVSGNKTMKLSQLGKQVRYAELTQRFSETYDGFLERTSAGSSATEPRHPWQRLADAEPAKQPVSGNQPADDDAQTERGPGTAPPERPGARDKTCQATPKRRGVARRRRLSRRLGRRHADTADAQDAMPPRPMAASGESRRLRSRRRVPVRAPEEHPRGEGEWTRELASRRSRVAALRRSTGQAPDNREKRHQEQRGEQSRQKRLHEPTRKGVRRGARAIETPARVPEQINRLVEQAVADVRRPGKGPLDGMGVSLNDLFRHVQKSRPLVSGIDIVLALHRMGLVPKSHVEQALASLEEEKRDIFLPSLIPEEPDREDDREL